jgi:hypothetical protein
MLEDSMSVWPDPSAATLAGSDGPLVSISIDVDARDLESLLEVLARVSFPINPQIYHDAAIVYLYPDGREETQAATLVEFPAYAGQIEEVREALTSFGFDATRAQVRNMLAELHCEDLLELAPPGSAYSVRYRRKIRAAVAAGQKP